MILTDPAELAQFLPNHVLQNLDNKQGFFAISESDFLAERLGRPLLSALQEKYEALPHPVIINDPVEKTDPMRPWYELVLLCQAVIAFDGESRSADIQAVSINQGGINITETNGYDIAPEKYIANYKAQCVKEAHAAVNRLLIQLEEWQKQDAQYQKELSSPSRSSAFDAEAQSTPTPSGSSAFDADAPAPAPAPETSRSEIVTLWQKSAYYYYCEGLLFSTAQQFGSYVNIYDSREKFIHLLPDIRYCQEHHIEAEFGDEWLSSLIERYHRGELDKVELKAYHMLQRTLALYVEARAPMFSSRAKVARDEATGFIHLTHQYITDHHLATPSGSSAFDADAPANSPSPSSHHQSECAGHCHCHSSDGLSRPGFLTSSLV